MKKKWIWTTGILLLVVGIITAGYVRINHQFPRSSEKKIKMGEFVEFQEGIYLKIDRVDLLTDQEREELYNKTEETPICESKIWNVHFILENRTNEDKNYEMTSLNLETQGGSTGISALFLSILKAEDGESLQGHGIIKPGERKEVICPYVLLSDYFTKEQWNDIENREKWITFASYPEKVMMQFE